MLIVLYAEFFQEAEDRAKEEEAPALVPSKGGKKGPQIHRPVDTDPDGDKLMHVRAIPLILDMLLSVLKIYSYAFWIIL